MSATEKTKTINIRAEEGQKQILTRAASLSGQNLSSFMLESATKEAEKRLEKTPRIEVTVEGMKEILEAIENPGEPNKELVEAAARFKKNYSNGRVSFSTDKEET